MTTNEGFSMPPLSFSSLSLFETCPHKYYRTKVIKDVVEGTNEHLTWGTTVHELFESAVKDKTALPPILEKFQPHIDTILAFDGEIFTEHQLAVNYDFTPVAWEAADAFFRGIADLICIRDTSALILDYKTGKKRITDQVKLLCLLLSAHRPEILTFTAGYLWIQSNELSSTLFTKEDVHDTIFSLRNRIRTVEQAYQTDGWAKTKNWLCRRWCPVIDCEHCGA